MTPNWSHISLLAVGLVALAQAPTCLLTVAVYQLIAYVLGLAKGCPLRFPRRFIFPIPTGGGGYSPTLYGLLGMCRSGGYGFQPIWYRLRYGFQPIWYRLRYGFWPFGIDYGMGFSLIGIDEGMVFNHNTKNY